MSAGRLQRPQGLFGGTLEIPMGDPLRGHWGTLVCLGGAGGHLDTNCYTQAAFQNQWFSNVNGHIWAVEWGLSGHHPRGCCRPKLYPEYFSEAKGATKAEGRRSKDALRVPRFPPPPAPPPPRVQRRPRHFLTVVVAGPWAELGPCRHDLSGKKKESTGEGEGGILE